MSGPLEGVRVLDLSRIMAGPWAGQQLADLGANVIKVERPLVGDDTRSWGPPYLADQEGRPTAESAYYLSVNRGKRSVAVDLASPQGQRVVRALAAHSDIVLENFKVGTLARYGLDYEALAAVNPALIYCSITGFGQTGPRRDQAAYDFMIQAMGGIMSVTGPPDGIPGGGPQKVGVPIVDLMTGMYAAVAVLAALERRRRTGEGEYIDLAMLDVQLSFLANQAMNYLVTGREPVRRGNRHPNIQPQNVYRCADGHLAVAVGNDGQFAKFATVLGCPEWASDERFVTNAGRVVAIDELEGLIADVLLTRTVAEWVGALERAGVPCGPINSVGAALDDVHARERGSIVNVPHPLAGTVPQVRSPYVFRNASVRIERHPPLLGEHTAEVLAEFGIEER
ncbi:CaiB/BaiF CoA-transferase family protein [Micromonospora sp. NPDC049523]|uniref:CaiB/BaiF CoA transferase family protein n=1 Tax=Micromonospora sp. NPDC049523 TaxID=3155921 RepID=UPI00341446D4